MTFFNFCPLHILSLASQNWNQDPSLDIGMMGLQRGLMELFLRKMFALTSVWTMVNVKMAQSVMFSCTNVLMPSVSEMITAPQVRHVLISSAVVARREERDRLAPVPLNHLKSVEPSLDTVVTLMCVRELCWTICVLVARITSAAQACLSR